MRKGSYALLLSLVVSFSAQAFDGRVTSTRGEVTVTYKVDDGYKIFTQIDTEERKAAYQRKEQSDVSSIDVVFLDVNKDGYVDVLIQHADETGYVPVVLINDGDLSFVDALEVAEQQFKAALYVNTEVDAGANQSSNGYELKDIDGDGMPELIFSNAFIDGKGYRHVVFKLDKSNKTYHLYKKVGHSWSNSAG